MPLRRLLVRECLHSFSERWADTQQNCNRWEQPVGEQSHHHFSYRLCPEKRERCCTARKSLLRRIGPSLVTDAQKNPASLDGVRDRLFDPIDGIGRRNRLANATRPDHLHEFA